MSVDNVVAGTSLGLLGFSLPAGAPLFGVMTALMMIAGLQVGRVVAHVINILTGVGLIVMAPPVGPG